MQHMSHQTFMSNKRIISWTLIDSEKWLAAGGPWNPGTVALIQEGAVSSWH